MAMKTITVHLQEEKVSALESLAEQMHLDRDSVLDEAVENYLWSQEQQRAMTEKGIRQLDAGQGIRHAEVMRLMEARLNAAKAARAAEYR